MAVNTSGLSLDKLRKELAKVEKAINVKEAKGKKDAMAKLVTMAQDSGIDLSELAASKTRKPRTSAGSTKKAAVRKKKKVSAKRGKVAPKYRNPSDPGITWTGRGRQPIWERDYLNDGGTIDAITI